MEPKTEFSLWRALRWYVALGAYLQLVLFAPVAAISLTLLVLVLGAIIFPDQCDAAIQYARTGFAVRITPGDAPQCEYKERGGGVLLFPAELGSGKQLFIGVPDHADWPIRVPAWARQRRGEILERIQSRLGDYEVEFEYLEGQMETRLGEGEVDSADVC